MMLLSQFSSPYLEGHKPKLEYDKPDLVDGKWLVSGKMIVSLQVGAMPGATDFKHPQPSLVTLEMPFVRAADEAAAVQQAAQHLESLANKLLSTAKALQGKS